MPGLPDARIAVGHVRSGLFPVDVQALDVGAAFHHRKRLAQHGRDVKHVRHPVTLEHIREAFRPAHSSVVAEHVTPRRRAMQVLRMR